MVRHIVMWNLIDPSDKEEKAKKAKADLEALQGIVPGLLRLEVCISPLEGSNRDIILESFHEDEAALIAYRDHPEHKRVAAFVGSITRDRSVIDFIEE